MSLNSIEASTPRPRIKLAQSLDEMINSETIYQTSKKPLIHPMDNNSFLENSSNSHSVSKVLQNFNTHLKTLKSYHKKPKQFNNSKEDLRSKALCLIDQNNQLNSLLESDIALQYLETQDISPKHEIRSLGITKREMIKANVQLNKKLFQRFFLDNYTEKLSPNKALEKLRQELDRLKGNSFDKENLNYYKTSHSFIEVQSAEFIKPEENIGYGKLIEDYKGLASENLLLKQGYQELHEKITGVMEENGSLKRANSLLLNELEALDRELKDSKDSLLTKPVDFGVNMVKNEEFKLLDDKITKLLHENAMLKQRTSQQDKTLEALIKGPRESSIVISQNIEKEKDYSLNKSQLTEIKEKDEFIKNFNESKINSEGKNSNFLKENIHAKCAKIIEDLKNELMEAHLCIADLENKIKEFWIKKKNGGKQVVIKKYDVSVNLCDESK